MATKELAAISLLKRAVELDTKKRKTEALICYKEGLQIFMEVLRDVTDTAKRARYRTKASEYMDRAELLSKQIESEKAAGNFHEQIRIEDHSIGHSYESLFGRFLDECVTQVTVEDPYIRSHHQVMNFLRLCEILVRKCSNLQNIKLLTSPDPSPSNHQEQMIKLQDLKTDLSSTRKINLEISFSETLHDREIRLSTGWVIKIGRGLDIFRAPPKGRFTLGYFDLDLRPCLETTVDIFHKNALSK